MKTVVLMLLAVAMSAMAFKFNHWTVNSRKSKIQFVANGLGSKVNGRFTGFEATIKFDPNNLDKANVEASIDVTTLQTGNKLRDKALKERADWFYVSKYPQITLKSRLVQATDSGYLLSGTLTIKDMSRPVKIPFTFAQNGDSALIKGQFTINRHDFNLGKTSGPIDDDIKVMLEVPVYREGRNIVPDSIN